MPRNAQPQGTAVLAGELDQRRAVTARGRSAGFPYGDVGSTVLSLRSMVSQRSDWERGAMSEAAGSRGSHGAGGDRIVALLLPELLGGRTDENELAKTLRAGPKPVRALLCLPDQNGDEFATALARLGVETEILLGPAVAAPATDAFALRAPPGTVPLQQIEFALALADAVLFAPGCEQNSWFRAAKALGRR